jgi:hypothetical protein
VNFLKRFQQGITSRKAPEPVDYLHIGGKRIPLYVIESVDGVPFVSGMQGQICTTYSVEDGTKTHGESNYRPFCISVDFAMEKYTKERFSYLN